jgi:hypothetical protein
VRRLLTFAAAGLLSGLGLLSANASGQKTSGPPTLLPDKCASGTCSGDYGTAVHFVKTPSEAARQALKDEKLVFVLHVSGLFENPDFT